MTTLGRYQGLEAILTRLEAVQARQVAVLVARSGAAIAALVIGGLVVVGLSAGYWPDQPPAALRWALLIGAGGLWAAALAWAGAATIRGRLNYAQAARLVEQRFDGLHNSLINAVQLSGDRMQPSAPLVQSAILEADRRAAKLSVGAAVSLRSLRRWGLAAGVAAAALLGFAGFQGRQLYRGLAAVFDPTGYVPHLGSVKLVSLTPGDATRFAGEHLTIVAKIENPQRRRLEGQVEIAGSPEPRPMLASPDRSTLSWAFGKLEQSFRYAVRIGDSKFPAEKPYYSVTVLQQVRIEGLDLSFTYPPYTRRPPHTQTNADGNIEQPVGTQVVLTLRLSPTTPGAVLQTRGGGHLAMRAEGSSFVGTLTVQADDAYRIVLVDSAGRPMRQLPEAGAPAETAAGTEGYFRIRAVPDEPPRVAFLEPNRDQSVAPGGKLPIRLRVSDDYGISEARLLLGREGEAARELPGLAAFQAASGKTAHEIQHAIEIGDQYRLGEALVYYATVTDNRQLPERGPQTTESARFKILIQDAARVAAERAKRYEQLRAKLLAILESQEEQRVNTEIAARQLAERLAVRNAGSAIAEAQKAIRAEMLDLVDNFPFEAETVTIQQALALLANNEAALAVSQARVLATLGEMDSRQATCAELGGTQDKIIHSLQTLLAILPSLVRPEAARQSPGGEDLPAEARESLAALKAALEKFIEEQRKIIQASDRLVKRPVDDFTAEQEKLLKELEVAQDKWEKLLNETFTDFSKLAQQDFSNPQLLKELISVKTDVTMAKDALKKQAIEIATAIEDNGIENARTLTANIDKWLPDEPDRIKWDMEDPAAQTNIEQPELPTELEDLVGDLLEEEEDLFEEMDDVTGKYAMSGDKGIGWDAMDGPISNMNAQGVTGNQLPNTSEISGRSGEGRQGKSLGEFVEDKAVGKGGRRTPTRLTPEPFQQGQVNDTSQEPAGGATGGGKLSGAGSEGLEGPLPAPLKEELKRLAGRHAQLLNKAERIQGGFKVTDYSNYQFLQSYELMQRVQREMEGFRYQNALRQKHVLLSGLKRTQLLLAGKIDVTADATANMPQYVKDDIEDTRKAKLPAEFREALKSYFRRLAEAGPRE